MKTGQRPWAEGEMKHLSVLSGARAISPFSCFKVIFNHVKFGNAGGRIGDKTTDDGAENGKD
jgi:hypothetical protein